MFKKPHPETCERCPNRYSERGCPCWVRPEAGFVETNVVTGDERIVTGCFYQVIPKLMIHVVRASNRPAAAVESLRNEMVRGIGELVMALPSPPEPLLLEAKANGKD